LQDLYFLLWHYRLYIFSIRSSGIFREIIDVDDCKVILEWYAHRTILPLMVFEIEVLRSFKSSDSPLRIELNVSRLNQSPDINFMTSQRFVPIFFYFIPEPGWICRKGERGEIYW